MKLLKKQKIFSLFFLICLIFSFLILITYNISYTSFTDEIYDNNPIENDDNLSKVKLSANRIDRTGKVFSSISSTSLNCYINNKNPNLDIQPSVYIPNYYISKADMNFENIIAHNYTRELETEPSEFYSSSILGPIYIYQKFSVKLDQYINNVSILIQDISVPGNPSPDRFWEVAIVNCSNDIYGTPNEKETLGLLEKAPPIIYAAHWELFDFKNEGLGPIYLNTSKTNSTIIKGIEKYWFALKIKIPPNDYGLDDYPKYLYFSQDSVDPSNIGEGDTFAESPLFVFDNYTTNYVISNEIVNGSWLSGGIDSFKDYNDGDRYFAEDDSYYLNITTEFELEELKRSSLSFYEILEKFFKESDFRDHWWTDHYKYIYSMDLYLATNISNVDFIDSATFYVFSDWTKKWENFTGYLDIKQSTERLMVSKIRNPYEKILFLTALYNPFLPNTNPNNSLKFRFEYNGTGVDHFNVSIDKFTVEVGELDSLETIQKHDPLIQKLYYVDKATVSNGTNFFGKQSIEALNFDDDNVYRAQAETNNLSIEFNFTIIPELNNTLWEGIDLYDWIVSYPNPIITKIDARISSNVSILTQYDLNYSVLEVYKGNKTVDLFPEEWNKLAWLPLSDNKQFAVKNETAIIIPFDPGECWILLSFMDKITHNIRFRLRYVGNSSFEKFNVSIDEFRLNFYIQNAIKSDIASTIGVGLNSKTLKPEDIEMQNFGVPISNVANQKGKWNSAVPGGIPNQGIFEFDVNSLWYAISFDVSGSYEIYKFEINIDFVDDLDTQFMTGTEHFTVEVTDGFGNPIPDLALIFELLDEEEKVLDEDTANTDSDGEATCSLEFDEVGDSFKIRVTYVETGIYASADIESDEFRIVDEFTLFMNNFIILLPYILIGLAALFTFIVLRHRKLSRLLEFWAEEAMVLEDLLKISYIMIIHKRIGITIYSKQISIELDSDLIGGFISAISHFRSEIKKPTDELGGSEGFEMDYHDFKIDMVDGKYIRTALILEGIPSEQLRENQELFTNSFETKFDSLLADFTGNVTPFEETDNLVEKFFNISLMYPLQLGSNWKFAKLNKLEKALLEVAEQMQKEREYFFISNLLNYGIAGRKESKNQIISTTIGLKRKGLLVPVEFT